MEFPTVFSRFVNNWNLFGRQTQSSNWFSTWFSKFIVWLVVSTPLRYISQLGWLFPNKNHVTNHQPVVIFWKLTLANVCYGSPAGTPLGQKRKRRRRFSVANPWPCVTGLGSLGHIHKKTFLFFTSFGHVFFMRFGREKR